VGSKAGIHPNIKLPLLLELTNNLWFCLFEEIRVGWGEKKLIQKYE